MTERDIASLRGIPAELAEQAGLRRVDSRRGAELIGRNGSGDYSGIIFPYTWPGDRYPREYRLRRDHPEFEQTGEGKLKEKNKYLSPPGRGNLLYFGPAQPAWLSDANIPVIITEGEKKTLALSALSWHGLSDAAETPRFLPIGLSGVWNWRGTIAKAAAPDGERVPVTGVISDIDKITWQARPVTILFDVNVATNESVQIARRMLASELRRRGATVHLFEWPSDTAAGINGIDDLIAQRGPNAVLELLNKSAEPEAEKPDEGMKFMAMRELLNEPDEETSYLVDGLLPMGGDSLCVAKPKVGKSTLARCLALKVARGDDFLGRKTNQGTVFYLALEEKKAEVRRHFMAMGVREDDPIFVFCATSPIDGLAQLRKAMQHHQPVLVIVDPLFRFVRMKDGNDYAAVTNALEPLHALARGSGSHVMAVHHAGKGERDAGDSVLGSTALFAAVDTLLILKRNDKYRTISSVQRYGADLDEMTLQYDEETRTLSAGLSRAEADLAETVKGIMAFLKTQSEPVEWRAIDDAVEGRKQTKLEALRKSISSSGMAGTINRIGNGKRGDPYLYFISGSGGSAYKAGTAEPQTVTISE